MTHLDKPKLVKELRQRLGLMGVGGADGQGLQEPVKDPARFPWHEVTRVTHYWLSVDAMTRPMKDRSRT